ncbi:MAG: FHA domain-containing protein [Myxococcales bacterium]|nr:FHA domain-containing protein [Polyangiaceae bacterium]MDW8248702.1 FHA domain-containing protein [Myxococcales bacterium]
MARFRLRFLLQEFDLPQGETILGRSPDCHVTIEDPLVSRHHAKVVLKNDEAFLEDLGSRNGLKLNNRTIKGSVKLSDGDRIRIGTQELVFCRVTPSADSSTKRTGFLRHCARCRTPYLEELGSCPHCGATDIAGEEETLAGTNTEKQSWTLQLLIEVVQRALALQRPIDAERLMRRAASTVDERLDGQEVVDRTQLDALAVCGARLSEQQGNAHWLRWIFRTYGRQGLTPPALAIEKILTLPAEELQRLKPDLLALVEVLQKHPPETLDATTLRSRLAQISQTISIHELPAALSTPQP